MKLTNQREEQGIGQCECSEETKKKTGGRVVRV